MQCSADFYSRPCRTVTPESFLSVYACTLGLPPNAIKAQAQVYPRFANSSGLRNSKTLCRQQSSAQQRPQIIKSLKLVNQNSGASLRAVTFNKCRSLAFPCFPLNAFVPISLALFIAHKLFQVYSSRGGENFSKTFSHAG